LRRGGKPERIRGVRYSRPLFPKLFFFFFFFFHIVPMQNCITLQSKSVEHSPPTHTHTHTHTDIHTHTHIHILSAKKPLPSYLPLAKALQPFSTILGPRVDKRRGQSDARRRGTFCCLSFLKNKKRPIDVLKEQIW